MTCATCGTENAPGAKFCMECAARLVAVCASCGSANSPAAKFCSECATPLGSTAAAPASATAPVAAAAPGRQGEPAPVAERRLVSVLFADLVGFTTLAEGRDPEETRELLSHYFDLARDIVERYGGTVEKFIGDAVMAVWGAPVAREDDAERAVRAGLELVAAIRGLGPDLQARAGVLTGEAAVTLGATNQGMVAGDLVNTASRLQSVAAPGTVLVGEATVRAADRAIAFEPAGEQHLKGKVAPVPAWRALRVVAERGGRNRRDTLEAPFVGRDDELRLLKDLYHATSREGRARLVSVIGPAGIGKSRLAWEFLKYVDGLVEQVWWHDGRSPAYGEGISFWALGEMVRGRCGLVETDDEPTTRAKVAATLREHVPDESERRWIEPALLALLGVESAVRSEELFGAWRTFFERLAVTGPVVMVFEDFHFADTGLLDFVDHLMEWSRTSSIYVLTLARPELLEKRPAWGAGKRNFVSVYLEPLPEPAMRELLAGLVPGLPETAVRSIVARADGVPLYAVETVRMLIADGRLRLQDGAYRPSGDLSQLAVPETLTALIASRLDTLAPDERGLISDAAVLGQSFTLAGLSAVSGVDERDLEPRLRGFVRRELLALEVDPRSPERGQYAFVQALIREVAYNTLARRDRKVRHLAAARFFESLSSDELAGGLAGHYLAAHANASSADEADALAAQARITLRAAAERAISLGALAQAVTFLDQAREVTAEPADIAELFERAGWAASLAGLNQIAEDRLRAAIDRRRELGDADALAGAVAKLGSFLTSTLRVDAGVAVLAPAVDETIGPASPPSGPGGVDLLAQLARAYFFQEEPRRAVEVAEQALEAGERLDLASVVSDVLITKGSALCHIGRSYEGLGTIRAGVAVADELGLVSTGLRGRINLGVLAGDPRIAYEAADAGLAIARRHGLQGFIRTLVGNLASAAIEVGEWDRATRELTAARDESVDELGANYAAWALLQLSAFRGDDVRAEGARLTAWADGMNEQGARDALLDLRAYLALATGGFREACDGWLSYAPTDALNAPNSYRLAGIAALVSRDAGRARQVVTGLEAMPGHARLRTLDARLLRSGIAALEEGGAGPVREMLGVIAEYERWGLPWGAALAGVVLARTAGGDGPDLGRAVTAARETLVRLGARPFLEALDEATGAPAPAGEPERRRPPAGLGAPDAVTREA